MTLRVLFTIVPYGNEDNKHNIHQLNIHNKRNMGLGFCEYYGTLDSTDYKGDVTSKSFKEIYHSRQDGALTLVRKVIERLEDTPYSA